MKIEIDRDGCISCGLCAEICPEVFHIAEDGLSAVSRAQAARTKKSSKRRRTVP